MEDFNPDDQLASLKAWWKQYGTALITGIVIGLVILVGGNYWKQYKIKRAETASQIYENMLADMRQGKLDAASKTAVILMQDYEATPYAGKSALLMARQRFDANDIGSTRSHLEWAMQNASESQVRHVARLRLARLQLDQGEIEPALKLIDIKDRDGFISEYEELRGDLLLSLGDVNSARQAYRTAIENMTRSSAYLQVLTMKRDNLGPVKSP